MYKSLHSIFYSEFNASPNWYLLDELEFCIKKKTILLEVERIAFIDEFYKEMEKGQISEGPGSQGKGHTVLKVLAQRWFKTCGQSSKTEVFFAGLHPDVLTDNHTMVIECGNTDPACIPIYLTLKDVKYAGVVPFPHNDSKDIKLYKFIKVDSYMVYLDGKKRLLKENVAKSKRIS